MRRAAVGILLALAILAIYAQTARFDFVNVDDPPYVSENAAVLEGLSARGAVWAFTTTREANWHPLTWLSLQADATMGGSSPRTFHLTNVALHTLSAILLFLLFERMTGALWRSALVAALFAVHPVHVESVAWVAERKDVLSTALGLLALHAWLSYLKRPSTIRAIVAVAVYAGSLMAKPMLVSLPLLMLFLDVWPLSRGGELRRRIAEKGAWFALAAASCVATFVVQAQGGAARSLAQYAIPERIANALVSYATYLAKAIRPSGLAAYYPYPYGGIPAWKVAGAAFLLLAVGGACLKLRAKAPYLLFGWLWYLVTLVPVIGLVQVGSQAMADRYTYVPLIGPFAMLAWGAGDLVARFDAGRRNLARAAASTLLVAALVALTVAARRQAAVWTNSVTLFTHALAVTKDNAVAHNGLATALFARGELDRAVAECAEAVRIAPGMGDAQSNLTRGLLAQGKIDEADARVRELLVTRPDDSRTHVNAGLVAMLRDRYDAAVVSFREALRLNPDDQDAHLNLAAILLAQGKKDEAILHFETAVRLRPGDAKARRALERARAR